MKYIFIVVFVLVFAFFDTSLGYSKNSDLSTHFTYMFQHSGTFHLAINIIAYWGVFRILEQLTNKLLLLALPVFCAFGASFFAMSETLTVGASALVYSMTGIFFGLIAFDKNVKIADRKKFRLFLICVAIGLIASFFRTNSNFHVHIYSIICGFISTGFLSLINEGKLLDKIKKENGYK